MLAERLSEEWRARQASAPIDAVMRFADAGLMLGAGTVLAPSGPSGRDLSIEGHEPRLLALLAAAHLCLPAVGALNHLRKAAQRWTEGEEDLAAIHLALSRLERLKRPEIDAHRLFLADGLLQAGFEAGAILKALNVDGSGIESFAKYRPDQPRVPAGSGRPSGQWTTEGGAPTAAPAAAQRRRRPVGHLDRPRAPGAPAPPRSLRTGVVRPAASGTAAGRARTGSVATGSGARATPMAAVAVGAGRGGTVLDLGAMSSRALGALAEFAAGVATASAAVAVAVGTGLAFTPVNGPTGRWVRVAGPGNVSYFRSPTERLLALRYTTADGVQHRWSTLPDPDGNYRGPDGKVIARVVKTGAKVGTLVSTAALLGTDSDKGRICPVPQKDRGGPRGQEYENYMKAWLNPDNPTPSGLAYGFRRPGAVDPTLIDDCQQKTGALAEYKGPNYAEHMLKNDGCWRHGMLRKMLEQADRQEAARQGRSLTWYFAEKSVADFMRREFQATHLDINVVWFPMPEGRK